MDSSTKYLKTIWIQHNQITYVLNSLDMFIVVYFLQRF